MIDWVLDTLRNELLWLLVLLGVIVLAALPAIFKK
jgi:hypothetical protein